MRGDGEGLREDCDVSDFINTEHDLHTVPSAGIGKVFRIVLIFAYMSKRT